MTDTHDTTTEAPPEVDTTDTETGNGNGNESSTDDGNGNREAAKYRTKLREAEAERDQLTEALDAYRTRDAVALAEQHGLADGRDAFPDASALADVLADDGTVDAEKVGNTVAQLVEQKPHWAKPKPDFGGGDRGIDVSTQTKETSWLDVIRPRS